MKLSLWQQFSSNHSAIYTIIGVFETAEGVEEAKYIFHQLIREAVTWNATQRQPNDDDDVLTEIEHDMANIYDLDWTTSIDWLRAWAGSPPAQDYIDDHVAIFGNNVVVDSFGESTGSACRQLHDLMQALGAKTYIRYDHEGVRMRIICTAPNPEVARQLAKTMRQHMQNQDRFSRPFKPSPWSPFHPLFTRPNLYMTPEQYAAVEQAWQTGYDLIQQATAHDRDDLTFRQALWRFIQESPVLNRLYEQVWSQTVLFKGTLSVEGHQIIFEEAEGAENLMYAVPALHAWLISFGCTIAYEFRWEAR